MKILSNFSQTADVVITEPAFSWRRHQKVDLSSPIMERGLRIQYRKPKEVTNCNCAYLYWHSKKQSSDETRLQETQKHICLCVLFIHHLSFSSADNIQFLLFLVLST